MKRIRVLVLIFAVISVMMGCAASTNALPNGLKPRSPMNFSTNSLRDSQEWANDSREKLKFYIGKPREELTKNFGKPYSIRRNIIYKGKNYQEEWRYWYSKGVAIIMEESWAYNFYINDGIVEYIEVN